jgi:hypothetical protein
MSHSVHHLFMKRAKQPEGTVLGQVPSGRCDLPHAEAIQGSLKGQS